jgi:E3 ubiquitin-protein ligase UBR7
LVLGGDDGKECTYAGGYLKRQAVLSCLTCVPDGVAGVCTACSLACHDGHEVSLLTSSHELSFPNIISSALL